MPIDLAVVIPVYNEEMCITRVVDSWRTLLAGIGVSHRILVLDDGSRDGTAAQLAPFLNDPAVEVFHQRNMGHGPTILRGYRRAAELADWVFQCDGDEEIRAEHFPDFWQKRGSFEAVLALRQRQTRTISRTVVSTAARWVVAMLFGKGVRDVNVPYRLMRAGFLKRTLSRIPPDTFAPNVIISGSLALARFPVLELPVVCEGRRSGTTSLVRLRLWKSAFISLIQILAFRIRKSSPEQP
jgi:glycosyltransferase involved in cell wall biosynthesis